MALDMLKSSPSGESETYTEGRFRTSLRKSKSMVYKEHSHIEISGRAGALWFLPNVPSLSPEVHNPDTDADILASRPLTLFSNFRDN